MTSLSISLESQLGTESFTRALSGMPITDLALVLYDHALLSATEFEKLCMAFRGLRRLKLKLRAPSITVGGGLPGQFSADIEPISRGLSSLPYLNSYRGPLMIKRPPPIPSVASSKLIRLETKATLSQLACDVVYLDILGLHIVVLNSTQAATELLEKRSAKFSDRTLPISLAHPDLYDWPNAVSMLPYNDIWRFHRRVLNGLLNIKTVVKFHANQEHQARLLIQRLLDLTDHSKPFEGVKEELFYTMAVSMFEMAFGYQIQGKNDPFLREAEQAFHNGFRAAMFANFYVNIFPALMYVPEWFPGAGWKRTLRKWKAEKIRAMSGPYEWVKARLASILLSAVCMAALTITDRPMGPLNLL
ncbi:hypothetical protein RSOLAG1IB_10116 [Rhizoctonia solani AG-1 IB]|uniref:Uncharacterized protein n=1 Tax=Thanatephorus cucumeris (strain AG1-IB / isolate 7/3/14) TaxID=1108050 RepID=A0A0B7FZ69_THACB|nr:hypothetical protein RSOLAG1IB_10116 [Rhizoctonia solani AG-1 IB]